MLARFLFLLCFSERGHFALGDVESEQSGKQKAISKTEGEIIDS